MVSFSIAKCLTSHQSIHTVTPFTYILVFLLVLLFNAQAAPQNTPKFELWSDKSIMCPKIRQTIKNTKERIAFETAANFKPNGRSGRRPLCRFLRNLDAASVLGLLKDNANTCGDEINGRAGRVLGKSTHLESLSNHYYVLGNYAQAFAERCNARSETEQTQNANRVRICLRRITQQFRKREKTTLVNICNNIISLLFEHLPNEFKL